MNIIELIIIRMSFGARVTRHDAFSQRYAPKDNNETTKLTEASQLQEEVRWRWGFACS